MPKSSQKANFEAKILFARMQRQLPNLDHHFLVALWYWKISKISWWPFQGVFMSVDTTLNWLTLLANALRHPSFQCNKLLEQCVRHHFLIAQIMTYGSTAAIAKKNAFFSSYFLIQFVSIYYFLSLRISPGLSHAKL